MSASRRALAHLHAAATEAGIDHARLRDWAVASGKNSRADFTDDELDDMARRIKADPASASAPVIALTAHALAGDRQRALDVGCADHHAKPVDFPRLLEQIEALLPKAA